MYAELAQSKAIIVPAALEQGRPDGGAGVDALVPGDLRHGIREGGADRVREPGRDPVGEARGIIALVAEDGALPLGRHDHGHGHVAALAEEHVGLHGPHDLSGLEIPLHHTEGIGEILPGEVTPKLSPGHGVIDDLGALCKELMLDALLRADVVDGPLVFVQPIHQRQVGHHVPRRAAAGKDDGLHSLSPCFFWFSLFYAASAVGVPVVLGIRRS